MWPEKTENSYMNTNSALVANLLYRQMSAVNSLHGKIQTQLEQPLELNITQTKMPHFFLPIKACPFLVAYQPT